MKVKIDEIKVNPGRRTALENDIEELAFSISEIGLLNPITLTRDYTLVAGLHRLEAVKLLGWTEVECTITDLNGLTAELAELDENFARTNLSPLEVGGTDPCGLHHPFTIHAHIAPQAAFLVPIGHDALIQVKPAGTGKGKGGSFRENAGRGGQLGRHR